MGAGSKVAGFIRKTFLSEKQLISKLLSNYILYAVFYREVDNYAYIMCVYTLYTIDKLLVVSTNMTLVAWPLANIEISSNCLTFDLIIANM